MLRLKGERNDDALGEDNVPPRLVDIEETDELSRRDVFPGDDPNEGEYVEPDHARHGGIGPLRGLAIAGAAFAPTFLLIFFGLPYLVGSAAPARTPGAPVATPAPEIEPKAFPSPSEAARGETRGAAADARGSLAGRVGDLFRTTPPPDEPRMPDRSRIPDQPTISEPPPKAPKVEEPAAAVAPEPVPSLPPARPAPPAAVAPPEPREPSRAASTPPSAVTPPVAEPRRASREAREWTPAAAFTDRAAAGRLASSIEKQGYPVEIRQDASSSRPWVVWIGAQPSGGSRRR